MRSKQCDCADTQSRCKHMLALKKIIDKNYYIVHVVIKEQTLCLHNAIYKEPLFNKEEIKITSILEIVNDDVEFYKEVEEFQK